ncbi:MAG: RNA polymerase sigma-70 factor [Adhaeribacter sp.]
MQVEEAGSSTLSIYDHLSPEEKVELLFRQYYAGLCKSLYRTLRDASLAEDIVQEVFVKVWDMRHSLRLDEAIPAYLYRSCYHAALNFLKSRKPQTDLGSLEDLVPGTHTAEQNLGLQETENQVQRAIEALPPKTRLVFSLSRFEELSYKEIADRLEISVKSVEKHMGIALQRLRENLREYLVGLLLILLTEFF